MNRGFEKIILGLGLVSPSNANNATFIPACLSFSDVLSIISVLIGLISIILSVIIYRLSNSTASKLAEDAAQRAFKKQVSSTHKTADKSALIDVRFFLSMTAEDKAKTRKKLLAIQRSAKKNSASQPWVHAAAFPIQLKEILNEEQTVALMYYWKDKKRISWKNNLENATKVYIEKGADLIEDFNSR